VKITEVSNTTSDAKGDWSWTKLVDQQQWPVDAEKGIWASYSNIDMCGQGDIEFIDDWKNNTTLQSLKEICEKKGYSSITYANANASISHAALKKFDYQLTKEHCKPISTCCKHPCTIWIYTRPGASKETP